MLLREISVPVSRVRGVGPAAAERLAALGILTVGDLLSHWPRSWDDRTEEIPLSAWDGGRRVHAAVTVLAHDWFGFGRMRTLKIAIEDAEGTRAELACFNRPFLANSFPVGSRAVVTGSFQWKYGGLQSSAFELEAEGEASRSVLPVYSLTAGVTQAQMRKIVARALAEYGRGIDSELPESVRAERALPAKGEVLRLMHGPRSLADAELGLRALVFEELFLLQYAVARRAVERRGCLPALEPANGQSSPEDALSPAELGLSPLQARLIERLPFELTADQLVSVAAMNQDLSAPERMARLLQGDVGSGKTLVAFLAACRAVDLGGQVALLAPTELLARQHAENAAALLEPIGIRVAFLTGNVKSEGRSRLLEKLASGGIDLVVGTHALFSAGVSYRRLLLAIVDEQHRFGVLQRSAILEKGAASDPERKPPHFLMMSATPIPRTLALSAFGDLDVSVIRSMPAGRKPIVTHLARMGNEGRVYEFVARELRAGRQAYFVYPLIEDGERTDGKATDLKSAERMRDELGRTFPGVGIALIHSRVGDDEQRSIMAEFRSGTIGVLVATSVVEVGVDVPNATCMGIEHAERFGLAALHQLRGRVGRGPLESYCFLVYADGLTEEAKARLRVMHETADGFRIAEEDMALRGPGDVAGIEQSGYLSFEVADPVRDADVLLEAREAAFALVAREAGLAAK